MNYILLALLALIGFLANGLNGNGIISVGQPGFEHSLPLEEAVQYAKKHFMEPMDDLMQEHLQAQEEFCGECFQMEAYARCWQSIKKTKELKGLNKKTLPIYVGVLKDALKRLGHKINDVAPEILQDFFGEGETAKKAVCQQLVKKYPIWTEEFWTKQFFRLEKRVNEPPKPPKTPVVTIKIVKCQATGDPHVKTFNGWRINPEKNLVKAKQHIALYRYNDFSVFIDTGRRGITKKMTIKSDGMTLTISPQGAFLNKKKLTLKHQQAVALGKGLVLRFDSRYNRDDDDELFRKRRRNRRRVRKNKRRNKRRVKRKNPNQGRYTFTNAQGITVIARVSHYINSYIEIPQNLVKPGNGKCVERPNKDDDEDFDYSKMPWNSPLLQKQAQALCQKFKLSVGELKNCLSDVKATKDIDAALMYVDVKKDEKDLESIRQDEISDKPHSQLFRTLSGLLSDAKQTRMDVLKKKLLLPDKEKALLKDKLTKFLQINNQEIDILRELNAKIGAEIIQESSTKE